MRPAFYCDLVVKKIEFEGTCDIYLEWALGIRRFDRHQDNRVAVGIDPGWSLRALHAGADLVGEHGARLSTRRDRGLFVLGLVHRDDEARREVWHNVVVLRPEGEGTRVQHACGRSGPAGYVMQAKVGAPSVVRRLLKWNGPDIAPLSVGDASVIHVRDDNARDVLDYFVLDRGRQSPVLLVTPEARTGRPLAAPQALAARLAGLVRVLACVDVAAVRAFNQGLRDGGFADEFAVEDGAIRLYRPQMDHRDNASRHPLWSAAAVVADGSPDLAGLAGELAERAMQGLIPAHFFAAVDRFDSGSLATS